MFSLKGCGSICFSIEMCETVLSAVSLFRYENYLIFLSACLYFFPSQIYVISSVIFYYYWHSFILLLDVKYSTVSQSLYPLRWVVDHIFDSPLPTSLPIEQQRGGGRLRPGPTHGGGQEPRQVVVRETPGPQETWPQEEIYRGGEPLLDGPWDDPWWVVCWISICLFKFCVCMCVCIQCFSRLEGCCSIPVLTFCNYELHATQLLVRIFKEIRFLTKRS